jgi:hypothetical protein
LQDPQKFTQIWIFGLETNHLATLAKTIFFFQLNNFILNLCPIVQFAFAFLREQKKDFEAPSGILDVHAA